MLFALGNVLDSIDVLARLTATLEVFAVASRDVGVSRLERHEIVATVALG